MRVHEKTNLKTIFLLQAKRAGRWKIVDYLPTLRVLINQSCRNPYLLKEG
jgi:hypothetical protein